MSTLIENQSFREGLRIENQDDLVIRHCEFSHRHGDHGLRLINCRRVRIEHCRVLGVGNESSLALPGDPGYAPFALHEATQGPVEPWRDGTLSIPPANYAGYVFTPLKGYGIHLVNCHHVTVIDNEVLDIFGQGIVAFGESRAHTSDITIEANRIAYIYDDAVKFQVKDDQNPAVLARPFRGGVVRGNLIHDIGLGATRLQAPRHGMYLKAADILVENNTIYNCFYGSAISQRNAGIIRNNRIWNCAYACIAYHTQTDTTGTSGTLLIENNDCRQDYALDMPQRSIGDPAGPINPCVQGIFLIGLDNCYPGMKPLLDRQSNLFVENVIVRGNRSFLYRDYPERIGERRVPHLRINGLGPDHRSDVSGNTFTDERRTPHYTEPPFPENQNQFNAINPANS